MEIDNINYFSVQINSGEVIPLKSDNPKPTLDLVRYALYVDSINNISSDILKFTKIDDNEFLRLVSEFKKNHSNWEIPEISGWIPLGTKGVFQSPYEQYAAFNGQKFTVVDILDKNDSEHDISETGVMYKIKFTDQSIIEAYPEELSVKTRNLSQENMNVR